MDEEQILETDVETTTTISLEDCPTKDEDGITYEGFSGDREEMGVFGFISLMVANYLKSLDYNAAYAVFSLRDIRASSSRVSPSFCRLYDKLREDAEKRMGGTSSFVMISDYIKMKEFNQLIDLYDQDVQKQIKTREFTVYDSVRFLAKMIDLTEIETVILQFYSLLGGSMDYELTHLISEMQTNNESPASFFAKTMKLPFDELDRMVNSETGLFNSGLLEPNTRYKNHFKVISKVQDLLGPSVTLNDKILEERLFPNMLDDGDLTIDDFQHHQENVEIMTNVINKGVSDNQKGVNVLLWGRPGTGKSVIPLILAKQEGWNLKIVGDIGKIDTTEKARNERLLALNVAQRLFQNAKNVVLLFDEMEDLFKFDQNATHSKAFVNRIIEKTPVPIIWTTNSMVALGEAVCRRMTFNIPFHKVPPASARKRMWSKYFAKYNREIDEEKLDDLAQKYDVVPALIANAVKVASYSDLNGEEIDRVLKNLDLVMNLGEERKFPEKQKTNGKFRIEFTNTNLDLNRLTNKILETGKRNFSILAYGPSGTGKSNYGIYLADQLGMRYTIKKASDLLSMWVGGTEKNIANMFEEAKENQRFIILDEADSFFQNRGSARYGWEVTQVNEMLTQMEKHDLPFVCTTNFEEVIDPAAFRRFTFKIKYNYLKTTQRENIYEHYFGRVPPKNSLTDLEQLAPGDFACIFEKMGFLGDLGDVEILEMLKDECEIKPSFKRKVGFN